MEENKSLRKKRGRELARRRKGLDEGKENNTEFNGIRGFWEKFGKQFFFTLVFATSIVFICFERLACTLFSLKKREKGRPEE